MPSKGALTKQHIIEKSIQLFSVNGYFNTSVAQIVETCGLTKGGLYGHFRSKEEIWYAAYDECVKIWKKIVLNGVKDIPDPLDRIQKVVENSMRNYLGADIFEGGCLLSNSLVELSRESAAMSNHILQGFRGFAKLLHSWLVEAEMKGMLREGLDLSATANFIVISLSGAAPFYRAGKDAAVWEQTISQISLYISLLRKSAPAFPERPCSI